MNDFSLSRAPIHIKLYLSLLLCMIGLTYLTLLGHIYIDTQFQVDNIIKVYGAMEFSELTDIAHHYLPFYTIYIFLIPVFLMLFTAYDLKWKIIFTLVTFGFILADIGSMYSISYISHLFAYVLWVAGSCLALTFLVLFGLLQYDLWLRRQPV